MVSVVKYLKVFSVDPTDYLLRVFRAKLIVSGEEAPELLRAEVFEGAALMLAGTYFEVNNLMASVRRIADFLAFLTIRVFDGVLQLFLIALSHSLFVVGSPELAVVLLRESASLQKQQELQPSIMLEMLILGDVIMEVEHTRREALLRKER